MHYTRSLFFLFFLLILPLESVRIHGPHFLSVGPEVYYLKREKIGGSWQDGTLFGVRANYEKLRYCGVYCAFDGYWASGSMEGETKSGKTLKSDITEYQMEGRVGYSFTFPKCTRVTWVPYVGYGSFCSTNNFISPSPLVYESSSEFQYIAGGGMILVTIGNRFNAGLDFKYKFPNEPMNIIKNDPDHGRVVQIIGREDMYEIEIPFRYQRCWKEKQLAFMFTPFYRLRHYGGFENRLFDFFDTRFNSWGARFLFQMIL